MPTVHIVDSVGIGPLNGRVVSNSSKNQRKIQGIGNKDCCSDFFLPQCSNLENVMTAVSLKRLVIKGKKVKYVGYMV